MKSIEDEVVVAAKAVKVDAEAVIAAVEAWYAKHFHKAAVSQTAPISSEDKASLIEHVRQVFSPKQE
ncbi:MAG: hypothetical protein ACRESO_04100 [Gammaproteobacteria bacterium]